MYAYESNSLSVSMIDAKAWAGARFVSWDDPALVSIDRWRFLSEPGYDQWDQSYCYGTLADGERVRVRASFHQMPRRNWKGFIVERARMEGIYIKGLTNDWEAMSFVW